MNKLIFGLLSLSLFISCGKDNDTPVKTKTDLLTQASWKFSKATVGGTDVSAFLQACQKDNVIKFNASGGSGNLDEGATKCNAADPQSTSLTWSFLNNETQLQINIILFTGGSNIFNIESLTETQLVASQNITVSGTTQNAVVTFIH